MGEDINVRGTIEDLDTKQDEYIRLESELNKYRGILAEKKAQLQENNQDLRE